MTTTTWFVLGLLLLGLAILIKKARSHVVPGLLEPAFQKFIPHLPYFIGGLGLLFLGQARNMVQRDYAAEYKKNRLFPHAWKMPLVGTQVAILYLAGVYGLLVGIHIMPPIESLLGLIVILLFFLGYLLWYVISHFMNRFPSFASLRIAVLAVGLAACAFAAWTFLQMVLVSLVFGLFAMIAGATSLSIKSSHTLGQHGNWVKVLLLAATVCMVSVVAYYAIPFGKPSVDLVGLGLAVQGLDGKASGLNYSPDGKKVAFCLKAPDGYFVQIVSPENAALPAFRIPVGDDACRPVFVNGGKSLMVDAAKGGERGLWMVNANTGAIKVLHRHGVQPLGDGTPWSEKTGQFLYALRTDAGYQLNVLSAARGKSKVLLRSANPIETPSWTFSGGDVAYADGLHGLFYVYNLKTRHADPLLSDSERPDMAKLLKADPVREVLPAPDGFRYLYVTRRKNTCAIWAVLADGTKRKKLYQTQAEIRDVSWISDAQKVVFEQRERKLGFLLKSTGVQVLDANLGTLESLIPPQVSDSAPAVSPDGVKVAFAASQGLWYSSGGKTGIWVALLR